MPAAHAPVLALHQLAGLLLQLLMQLCSGVLVALLLTRTCALCRLKALLHRENITQKVDSAL